MQVLGRVACLSISITKKDIYIYLMDMVILDYTRNFERELLSLPDDLFARTVRFAEVEFEWCINNPDKFRFLEKTAVKSNMEISDEVEHRYNAGSVDLFYRIFDDVNRDILKWDIEKLLYILKMVFKGI